MDGSGFPAQLLWHLRTDLYKGGRPGRVHLLHRGVKDQMAAVVFQQGPVPGKVPGIGRQILSGAELGGIDKHRSHHPVTPAGSLLHQTHVALVKVSHGGHQAHGEARSFPSRHLGPNFPNGLCDLHRVPPPFR